MKNKLRTVIAASLIAASFNSSGQHTGPPISYDIPCIHEYREIIKKKMPERYLSKEQLLGKEVTNTNDLVALAYLIGGILKNPNEEKVIEYHWNFYPLEDIPPSFDDKRYSDTRIGQICSPGDVFYINDDLAVVGIRSFMASDIKEGENMDGFFFCSQKYRYNKQLRSWKYIGDYDTLSVDIGYKPLRKSRSVLEMLLGEYYER